MRTEAATDAAYAAAGVHGVPASKAFVDPHGKWAKVADYVKDAVSLQQVKGHADTHAAVVKELQRGFVADAVLGNGDVIGLEHDNVLVTNHPDEMGKYDVHRIDNGGSLFYRAQGQKKAPGAFGPEVAELKSMRDPNVNASAALVFGSTAPGGGVTDAEIKAQAAEIVKRKDKIVKAIAATPYSVTAAMMVGKRIDWLKKNVVDNAAYGKATPASPPLNAAGEPMTIDPNFKPDEEVGAVNPHSAGPAHVTLWPTAHKPTNNAGDWDAKGLLSEDPHAADSFSDWGAVPPGQKPSYGGIVYDGQGRILMRKVKGGFGGAGWTFPKGKLDKTAGVAEHPLTAALREVREETGHTGVPTGYIPGAHKGTTGTTWFYAMRSAGQDPTAMDGETEDTRWVTPTEAHQLITTTSTDPVVIKRDLGVLDAATKALNLTPAVVGGASAVKPAASAKPAASTDTSTDASSASAPGGGHDAFDASDFKFSMAVQHNHPLVVHLTKQIIGIDNKMRKLVKGGPEHTALKAQATALRGQRAALWKTLSDDEKKSVKVAKGKGGGKDKLGMAKAAAAGVPYSAVSPKAFNDATNILRCKDQVEWDKWLDEQHKGSNAIGKPAISYVGVYDSKSASCKEAISEWTGSSRPIRNNQKANAATKASDMPADYSGVMGEALKPRTIAFEMAIAKAPRFDGQLYRGIRGVPSAAMKALTTVGTEFVAGSHDCWSKAYSVADCPLFSGTDSYGKNIIFHLAKSTRGSDLGSHSIASEKEVVVAKGARYRVIKVEDKPNSVKKHVYLEEIEGGMPSTEGLISTVKELDAKGSQS